MRLLIVVPESPFLTNPVAFPPLGSLYVAASAESMGAEVRIVDLSWQELPDWDYDYAGISASTSHVAAVRSLIPRLRVPVIVGGPHFDIVPNDYMEVGADAASRGDGEDTIRRFLTGERGLIDGRCDDWPMPARHLIDLSKYRYDLGGVPTTSMVTSRGCPYSCAYCCKTSMGRKVRLNPIEKVREEVREIKRLGFGGVMLYDDEINLTPGRLEALCDVMRQEGMRWRGFVRSDLFSRRQAEMMKESGCYELCSGVESGSDEILTKMGKRAKVADATRCRRICREVGIRFKAFMMIGLPGETEDTIRQTERWLLAERPDDFDLCPFIPYPGSPIMNDPGRYGVNVVEDYWHSSYFHKAMPGSYRVHSSVNGLSADKIAALREEIYETVHHNLRA